MLFLISKLWLLSLFALSEPSSVYLKPNHPAATGHFSKKLLLEKSVGYDQFEWLWVSNTQGQSGWVLKSSVLLPLDFSRQAVISKGEALYSKPRHFQSPSKILENSQLVNLIDRKRSWYKIVYKEGEQNKTAWVRAQYLSPHSKDAGLFFSTQPVHLRQSPKPKSNFLASIESGDPIVPLNTKGEWAYVQYGSQKGYIPFRNLRTRMDVAIKVRTDAGYFKPHPALYKQKIHEIFANPQWAGTGPYSLELKARPDMASPTVATVQPWHNMVVQGYTIKRWGASRLQRLGTVWWFDKTMESNVERIQSFPSQLVKLSKDEIYQIEKSKAAKELYFASATSGIYRSFDLKNWQPLGPFKNGFPIKLADNGVLFVGDKVSFDHGESFRDFIRWDLVFESLPNKEQITQGPLQILNVEPHKGSHKRLTLSLKVGKNKYMQLYTADFGKSWRIQ